MKVQNMNARAMTNSDIHSQPVKLKIQSYKPLIIMVFFCLALVLSHPNESSNPNEVFIHTFMGYFFLFLSIFKFFDMNGFIKGFATHDFITQKFHLYGYVYPFLVFSLGFAYISQFEILFLTIIITISGIGVINSIRTLDKR